MSSFKTIKYEKNENVAIVYLNKPERMNALDLETINELKGLFTSMENDPEVYGVIITGEGRAFCAGADLSRVDNSGGNKYFTTRKFVEEAQSLMNQIEEFSHPVIAAINGFALGGGCELALACDLRIASSKALFGLPETTLGVIPCFGGTQRLPRLIGVAKAKEIIFTGRKLKSDEALTLGLINTIAEPDELLSTAKAKMAEIIANAPLAVKMAKTAINKGIEMPIYYSFELEADMTALLGTTQDAMEGGLAFYEKRKPNFKNQ